MYTAKEYQKIIIGILEMKAMEVGRQTQECNDPFKEEKLGQYQMGLYAAIDTINKSSFLIKED